MVTATPVIPEAGAYPNPYVVSSGNLMFVYELAGASPSVRLLIYTMGFRVVTKIDFGACAAGRQTKILAEGIFQRFSTGLYLYVLETESSGGVKTRSKIGTLMVVRNN